MSGSMYAPDYLRSKGDPMMNNIASLIESQIRTIQNLKNDLSGAIEAQENVFIGMEKAEKEKEQLKADMAVYKLNWEKLFEYVQPPAKNIVSNQLGRILAEALINDHKHLKDQVSELTARLDEIRSFLKTQFENPEVFHKCPMCHDTCLGRRSSYEPETYSFTCRCGVTGTFHQKLKAADDGN